MSLSEQRVDRVSPLETTETDTVVHADNLTLGFGSKTVVTDINISFPRGSITALIGPTGSGKTTFLRTLNRMNDKVSGYRRVGDVQLDGTSIWTSGVHLMSLRRRVGMVFQRPNPFPMSILDNVVSGVRAHRIAHRSQLKDIAETRLREVGLWEAVRDRLKDSPFRLSGGQQQLLCLARSLAIGPDVLLLDEPTSSLDPISVEEVERLIRRLCPAITIVIVTHNLAQARRLSDNTALFYSGRLMEFGPTTQVFGDPQQPETASYVTGRVG
jgi:phosphate transport system ATP-binding protein